MVYRLLENLMDTKVKLSRTSCREFLDSISTPTTRKLGGYRSAHAAGWHVGSRANLRCDLCKAELKTQGEEPEGK
jgi:hypothetical protein